MMPYKIVYKRKTLHHSQHPSLDRKQLRIPPGLCGNGLLAEVEAVLEEVAEVEAV